jgi:hypothetical protein
VQQHKLVYFNQIQKNFEVLNLCSRLVLEVMEGSSSVCISKPHGSPRQLWDFEQDGTIRSNLGKYLDVLESRLHYVLTTKSKGNYTCYSTFRIIPVSW